MISLGPAGTNGNVLAGMDFIKKKGLNAVEIEFTHGVWMNSSYAKEVKTINKTLNLKLSVHAPYFINLASLEPEKIVASKKRILDSCKRAHEMGAKYVVFHPGFLMGRRRDVVHELITKEITELQQTVNDNKWNVVLAPETTGKLSQYGDLDELLLLKKKVGCGICVDFAHLLARNAGVLNYSLIISKLESHIHAHFSGIEYTEKGEKKHIPIKEHEFISLAKPLLKSGKTATIICESPVTLKDTLKMKSIIERLKK